ncbi:MAG: type II secretion system F family protein [Candidatus Diapherotrites archaeon]|nr:type II secretion system F family protein [Candidatus Diapherotrites archaeon]
MSALFQGSMLLALIAVIMYATGQWELMTMGVGMAAVLAAFVFMQTIMYPSYVVRRRVTFIDKDFLQALRHIVIQVKGGTPVFNSLVSVGEAGYGNVSSEVKRTVQEVNAGVSMTQALENLALRNPSIYLRRTVWQIVNAIRMGTDMGATLDVIVEQFTAEQRVLFEKFSKELSPWAMMYMMITVIFPTLGITLFLIISSLSSLEISEPMLLGYLAVSTVTQYFFIQMIKSKRPTLRW